MKTRNNTSVKRLAVLLLAVTLLCTGCGTVPQSAEEPQETSLAFFLSQEDEFLLELKAGIEAEAAAQGCTLRCYTANGDPDTQISQVHEALADGVDTLLVNLASDETGERICDIVGDANVVFVNRAPTRHTLLNEKTVFVGMDETQCGLLQGEALVQYFQEQQAGVEIRYLLFQGVPGLENTDARSNGALQALTDAGYLPVAAAEFQICDFYREQAHDAMARLLTQEVAYDCVICNNDAMALGVIDALKEAGKDPAEVPIVGVDCTADGAAALEAGTLFMTVDQDAQTQAEAAVSAAVNLERGLSFDDGIRMPEDDEQAQLYTIRIPVTAVTA